MQLDCSRKQLIRLGPSLGKVTLPDGAKKILHGGRVVVGVCGGGCSLRDWIKR